VLKMDSEIIKFKKIVREVTVSVFADLIVEKLNQELKLRKKKLLVVFSGGAYGLKDSVASIKALIDEGYKTKVVLSKSADKVLGRNLIKSMLGFNKVYVDGDENIDKFLEESDILILPSLTINSAAKVACCICDNYLTRAANYFILRDKIIYASTNSCCPKDDERVFSSMNPSNSFYEKKMIENMETVKSYGVSFSHAKDIYNKIANMKNISALEDTKIYCSDKKIFTKSDVVMLIENSTLKVQQNSIFTALAKEQLVKNKIKTEIIN